jgi:GAF domain-containing protein
VAEAQRMEELLRTGITPVAAPVTLAARVAGAVAVERERRQRPGGWLAALSQRRYALAALALVLAFSAVSYALAPGAVTALVQRVLLFVPGLGIKAVPGGNLVGITPNFYNQEHASRLQIFADQAAIAIENARLYAEVQRLATLDDVTGIFNRRRLFELGRVELERARRYNTPLAAILLDIDLFKKINDTTAILRAIVF